MHKINPTTLTAEIESNSGKRPSFFFISSITYGQLFLFLKNFKTQSLCLVTCKYVLIQSRMH